MILALLVATLSFNGYAQVKTEKEMKQEIKKMEEMHLHNILDTQFNMTFIAHIAHTMVQHRVLLNDGRTGQVVMINRLNVSRPLVQVGTTFVDLSKEHSLYIQELLD